VKERHISNVGNNDKSSSNTNILVSSSFLFSLTNVFKVLATRFSVFRQIMISLQRDTNLRLDFNRRFIRTVVSEIVQSVKCLAMG
jgi:hypothetical protein